MHTVRPKQLPLPYPITFAQIFTFPSTTADRGATIRDRQPKRFPPGWFSRSLRDPQWREKHEAEWIAKRKAHGLPHVVKDRGAA